MPPEPHRVVCIGSAGDLRDRLSDHLRDHLRGSSGNALFYRYIADGAARVRFRLSGDGWRWGELELYRVGSITGYFAKRSARRRSAICMSR